jgi:HAD superfamily hydrolase (TIGR01549 family)
MGVNLTPQIPTSDRLPRPRVILFDMDDTIFDHALTCRAALGRLRTRYPLLRTRSLDLVWQEYTRLLEWVQPQLTAGRRTVDEARTDRFQRVAAWCGETIDAPAAEELSRNYRGFYQELRRPVPGAPALLRRLHEHTQIGVVTNNDVAEQEEKLAFLRLDDTVDFLVASRAIGIAKPDARIFRAALDRAGAAPAEAVMLGDSWEHDIVGAHGAGIRAVWFNRFGRPRPAPLVVDELKSFRAPRAVEALLTFRPA